MSNNKLFPTSAVGSYPQTSELRKSRREFYEGKLNQNNYLKIVGEHTKRWVEFQRQIELDFPVSGEFLRGDMAEFFGLQLGGRLMDFVPSYENRCYRPIEYHDYIYSLDKAMTVGDFTIAQSWCPDHPIKHTITGPVTLADWGMVSQPHYYRRPASFRKDLAIALKQEMKYLKKAGVKILQIDEPAFSKEPDNLQMDLDSIQLMLDGLQKAFYLILHICYSDLETLDDVFPHLLSLPFHQIHMEMANRNYVPLALIQKYGLGNKDLGLGVIDVHTNRIETVDEVVAGVTNVRQYLPAERIHLLPDCGLKERSEEVAKAKMQVLVEAARICREKLA